MPDTEASAGRFVHLQVWIADAWCDVESPDFCGVDFYRRKPDPVCCWVVFDNSGQAFAVTRDRASAERYLSNGKGFEIREMVESA
jgi:hypothetical protein